MRTVTAREANQGFSALLSRVENGEEILVTKRGRPVAILAPYRDAASAAERDAAASRVMAMMKKGLPWGPNFRTFTRDEMNER